MAGRFINDISGWLHFILLFCHRTLTLLINIVTMKSITNTVTVSINYGTAAAGGFDPFWYQKGFAGHTQRLIHAKKLLDNQVVNGSEVYHK